MARNEAFAILIASLVFAGALSAAVEGGQKPVLPAKYRTWLDEEAVYIITPVERDVFLKLSTDRERDLFIEAFWAHRDPTPDVEPNEFKTEHYRRLNYANRYFGRVAGRPGWRTDRGRVYIILGEPNDIQRFDGKTMIYPAEVWFYQNKDTLGLPPGFNLVFFQENGLGDYKLYSPAQDGPMALMTSYAGDPLDYQSAYDALREIEPALADASLSLIPGERDMSMGRPTLASDLLLQRVDNVPQRQVEEKYAQKFLEYKDTVDVEYSTRYIDSDGLVKITKEQGGLTFVHYAVEPRRLSVAESGGRYSTVLKVNGHVATVGGKPVYQFEKTATVNLDETQVRAAASQPFDFHDVFPLIPGTFRFTLLLKNEASKEFTTLERTVVVPGDSPAIQMTSPLLAYRSVPASSSRGAIKPFQYGSRQLYGQPGRAFTKNDTLTVAFQVQGFTPQSAPSGRIRFAFRKNDEPSYQRERRVEDLDNLPFVYEEFPLAEFAPAHYTVRIALFVADKEVISASDEFDVGFQTSVARPWFFSKLAPGPEDPRTSRIVGQQLFEAGRAEDARPFLEDALRRDPEAVESALALAGVHMALNEPSRAAAILDRFLGDGQPPAYEVFVLAGRARLAMGDVEAAAGLFDRAVARFGVNAVLLNAIGECRLRQGRPKEALEAWEKSLELSPDQPDIRKKADALREKK